MTQTYQVCTRCIMDTTDPDIVFDENGVCNHCHHYDKVATQRLIPLADRPKRLQGLIERIKQDGKGKNYDCIIGVSGGVDSTYVAYLTRELGLRPLAIHFDNGWNSEIAAANIEKTLKNLDIDLYTYVINWPEFRDLQLSFLRASTPDGEVPTDHAIVALLYKMAVKYRLKHILLGVNVNSEAIMPRKWGYGYSDFRYIRAIHQRFGKLRLKTYPHYTLPKLFEYMFLRKVKLIPILDFIDYQKADAMKIIEDELGWVYYGGKHYESVYTRFYQSQVLVQKFAIDKRRAHFSNLVLSGQLTRQNALSAMCEPACPPDLGRSDKEYVLKKFALTDDDWERIMQIPVRYFSDFPNSVKITNLAKQIMRRSK